MKILLIHQSFVSPHDAGGTRHFEFARMAKSCGHEVTIVASDLSYLTGKRHAGVKGLVTESEIDGVRVLRAWTLPALHRSFVWRVVSFVSFMITSAWAGLRSGRVDIVMGTSPPIFQAVSAWVVASLKRRPLLLEIRDLWPDFAVEMGVLKNPFLIRLSRMLELFLYRRSHHLLINSPAYRKIITDKGVSIEKISIIANGVDPEMFDPANEGKAVRSEFGLQDKIIVLYAGALGMANDISTILKAAEITKNDRRLHWVFAGDGKERSRLQQESVSRGLEACTLFTGARPKSDMKHLMGAADICVATLQNIKLFRTTYPNKVFDYMAAGRPTVLGIDGVIREVIEAAQGGIFVPPGDPNALAAAVLRLIASPGTRLAQGAAARQFVIRHFNRHEQARDFVRLMERIHAKSIV
jgi:glycosyltransferase involved in cell wall biosynthesis